MVADGSALPVLPVGTAVDRHHDELTPSDAAVGSEPAIPPSPGERPRVKDERIGPRPGHCGWIIAGVVSKEGVRPPLTPRDAAG
jgi:hypothetical protein